jgi:glycosyltransferase involved in cell wall biosynthesis
LLVIGDGPMGEQWKQLVAELGLGDRIHFLADIHDDALPAYYQACDIFVLPASQRSEAFGTVLLEAMACGKPQVSTELGTGTSWVNQHGETGLVTPAADPAALVAAIGRLLADDALRVRMGQAARRRVETEFSDAMMLQRIEALYRELL